MSWSYVGGVTTGNVNSGTTGTITLPAGVNGGDLIVVSCCFYNTTFTQASFTMQQNTHGNQSAVDCFWLGTRIAGGTAGSGTTDSTFTITFGATTWGEWIVGVWRATNGVGSIIGSAEYHTAAGYVTACPDAVYTVSASGNLNIWGYAGQNSSVGTTATSFSGTGPSALTNFIQEGFTGNGGGVGMGWKTTTGSPGGATANQAVDPTDFALEVAEAVTLNGPSLSDAVPVQIIPGFIPGVPPAVTGLSVNAGLATGLGTAGSPGQGNRTAGLATGQGNAAQPATPFTAGLAIGTGTSQPPAQGNRTAGLATGTGTSQPPSWQGIVALLASGAGTAGQLVVPSIAGLATGVASSQSPSIAWTAGLATGSGAAGAPAFTFTAGLATGTGTSQPSSWQGITALLASGSGIALGPSLPAYTVNAGLATGTGSAAQPVTPWIAGLATGTGAAVQPGTPFTAGLATGTGTAQVPRTGWTAGLATGTGTAQGPAWQGVTALLATGAGHAAQPGMPFTAGLATGTGTAQSPAWQGITALLATGQGKAAQPGTPFIAGLATGTGTSQPPSWRGITALVATGHGTAFGPMVGANNRPPQNYGGTATPVEPYGGMLNPNTYGGSATVTSLNVTAGGTGHIVSKDSTSGGSATRASLDVTSGGTATPLSTTLGGSVSYGNTLGGALIGWTMQQVNLTLAENNDETVNFAVTNNSSALDISTATINVYFKTAAGTADNTALMFSSGGGSPAITITNGPGGLCSLAIPHADLYPETYTFYRLDVVFSGLQNTAIYGNITWVTL